MNEDQASEAYWVAVHKLQEVIGSGYRGGKDDVVEELTEDLE